MLLLVVAIIALYYIPELWREELPDTFPETQEGETEQSVKPHLTRKFNSNEARLYIIPNDPVVQQILNNIVKNYLIANWIEIRDWVANNIQYISDSEAHGVSEFWQLPT